MSQACWLLLLAAICCCAGRAAAAAGADCAAFEAVPRDIEQKGLGELRGSCRPLFLLPLCVAHYNTRTGVRAAWPKLASTCRADLTPTEHYSAAQQRAGEETWLQHLLGTDCFTRAVQVRWRGEFAAPHKRSANTSGPNTTCMHHAPARPHHQGLQGECNRMTDEQRTWLAIHFTTCQQRLTRQQPFSCRQGPGRLKACVESMDTKTHHEYTTLLTHVHSMCLFFQNQRFQEMTARLVNDMAAGSRAANATLAGIRSGLEEQRGALEESREQIDGLQVGVGGWSGDGWGGGGELRMRRLSCCLSR
jgi:hypothetical protein